MQNKSILIKLSHFLATGFYSGLSPVMPGTCGTLVSAVLLFILNKFFPFHQGSLIVLALFVVILAIIVSEHCLKNQVFSLSSASSEKIDPQQIVIDEFAGYYVSLCVLNELNLSFLLWGFIFFRLFDMTKISLVKKAETLPGAWGIVADDIVAGVFAAICLKIVLIFS